MSASDSNIDFGANDWLVEEMQERYLADPNSVEPAWVEYFTKNGISGTATNNVAPKAGVPPIPKAMQAQAAAPVVPAAPAAPAAPVQAQQPVVTAPVVP